jgi:hypothetical protein
VVPRDVRPRLQSAVRSAAGDRRSPCKSDADPRRRHVQGSGDVNRNQRRLQHRLDDRNVQRDVSRSVRWMGGSQREVEPCRLRSLPRGPLARGSSTLCNRGKNALRVEILRGYVSAWLQDSRRTWREPSSRVLTARCCLNWRNPRGPDPTRLSPVGCVKFGRGRFAGRFSQVPGRGVARRVFMLR